MLVAAALYLGFVVPAMSPSPVLRRIGELSEYLALVTMPPLTCWICGLYDAVRPLSDMRNTRHLPAGGIGAYCVVNFGMPLAHAVSPPPIDGSGYPSRRRRLLRADRTTRSVRV